MDGKIVAITDKCEIEEIEQACNVPYSGCKAHIEKAVGFLADREHKDYKNCIKESISAVESICQIIVGDDNATLGGALKKLKDNGINIHAAMESAFQNYMDIHLMKEAYVTPKDFLSEKCHLMRQSLCL